MRKIWPQLLSASEPFVLVNGWNGNCFFWWPGCDDIVHPPEHLLSCFPRLQRLKPPCWRFQNFLSQAGTKIVVQRQLESKDLQSGVAIPCNTRWCVYVEFVSEPTLFQNSYGEKHVLCKNSSKNATIPFMDLLKNARTPKNLHMLGLWRILSTTKLMTLGKVYPIPWCFQHQRRHQRAP